MKILVSDKLANEGMEILKAVKEFQVDLKTGLKPEELKAIIKDYDALIVRSETKVTAEILEAADKTQSHRPRRCRVGQCGFGGGHQKRRCGDEYPGRQYDLNGGTHDEFDFSFVAQHSSSLRNDESWTMGPFQIWRGGTLR